MPTVMLCPGQIVAGGHHPPRISGASTVGEPPVGKLELQRSYGVPKLELGNEIRLDEFVVGL